MSDVLLRPVIEADIPVFFQQQLDPVANQMAAFAAKDPTDKAAFTDKWRKILNDASITKQTILFRGQVAGNVVAFVAPWSGNLEVSYWLGRGFWGKGIATKALVALLKSVTTRPLFARVARDNVASIRVLEKCGFRFCDYEQGFASARGEVVEEVVMELKERGPNVVTLDRVADLSDAERERIRVLSVAVYPPEQYADWPGRQMQWSAPEWCVRVRDECGTVDSYAGVYVRAAECDGKPVRVGGIGSVKTHPAARGRGLAALAIRRGIDFLWQQEVHFALLVCEPSLIGYYGRLGWRDFGGRLLVRQRGAKCEFTFNCIMTHEIQWEVPDTATIDLCGPPW